MAYTSLTFNFEVNEDTPIKTILDFKEDCRVAIRDNILKEYPQYAEGIQLIDEIPIGEDSQTMPETAWQTQPAS